MVASLIRRFGYIDIAEDAAAEALLAAVSEAVLMDTDLAVADDHRSPQGPAHRQDPPRVPPRRQVPAGRR